MKKIYMDIIVGNILVMKKNHPCGNNTFTVMRIGMDFKIRCTKCNREIMLPRNKIEKQIKNIIK